MSDRAQLRVADPCEAAAAWAVELQGIYPALTFAVRGDDANAWLQVSGVVVSARESAVPDARCALWWGTFSLVYNVPRGAPHDHCRSALEICLARRLAVAQHGAGVTLEFLGEVFEPGEVTAN